MDKISSGEDGTQLDTDYRICCQRINRALTISLKRHVILSKVQHGGWFSSTYTKIGTIQSRLAWPLGKHGMEIPEMLYLKKKKLQHETFSPKRFSNYNSNCIIFFFYTIGSQHCY